jgi:hypothetical protein
MSGSWNGSDQVGRNYMFHASQAVLGEENTTVYQKTLGLNDFYFANGDYEYPLGNIQMVGKSQVAMFRGERPRETKLAPEWTLDRIARHAIDFWLSTEDLPRPENRVTVDKDGKLTLAYTPTNEKPKEQLLGELKTMLGKLDMNPGSSDPPVRVHEERDPNRGRGAPGGHLPVRDRPGHLGPRRRLQGPRARQPLRRGHERLPVDRCGEPGAHGDGQRAARRRPPARAPRVTTPR